MQPNFGSFAVSENLLHESIEPIFSIEPVLFFYLATVALAAILWTLGVLAFGRRRRPYPPSRPTHTRERQRVTPVAS